MRTVYDRAFFADRDTETRYSAEQILNLIAEVIPSISSVADVGCGTGTWLAVAKERGATNVIGFDGDWVDLDLLEVDAAEFLPRDLALPIESERRYDLAISLEVAEHLPIASAQTIVQSLTSLSDFVLFSAAIPGQGGVNHVNERWQSYWAGLFGAAGYDPFDVIRPHVWTDSQIGFPYRQNTLLYVTRSRQSELRTTMPMSPTESISIVHPELFLAATSMSIRKAWRDLGLAVRRRFFGGGA